MAVHSLTRPLALMPAGGLDSLGAVEYVNLVSRRLGGLPLPATLIFDHPTTAAITTYLTGRLAAAAAAAVPVASSAPAATRKAQQQKQYQEAKGSFLDQLLSGPDVQTSTAGPIAAYISAAAGTAAPSKPIVTVLAYEMAPLLAPSSPHLSDVTASSCSPTGASGLPMHDNVVPVPYTRWDRAAARASDGGTSSSLPTQFGAFLAGVEEFDAAAFGLSSAEAVAADPQHRLLLQLAVTASSAASSRALPASAAGGSATGVFLGISWTEYHRLSQVYGSSVASGPYAAQGAVLSVAAGRISYHMGMQGPSLAVDTACSSSLVATTLAYNYLSDPSSTSQPPTVTGVPIVLPQALVGGINMMLLPSTTAMFERAGMLSASGRCKALDSAADGYVRAEAAAMMVLGSAKAGAAAAGAGSSPLALLCGASVNQDGRSSSLTAPNGPAQQALIRSVLSAAELAPVALTALQMHGTGTPLGDPIEVRNHTSALLLWSCQFMVLSVLAGAESAAAASSVSEIHDDH